MVVFAAAVRVPRPFGAGHPGIYVTVTREIQERGNAMGVETVVASGISSIDTMILQLGLENRGLRRPDVQANRFIYHGIVPDRRVPLFLPARGCWIGHTDTSIDKPPSTF